MLRLPLGWWPQWPVGFAAASGNVLAFVGLLALISGAAGPQEQGRTLGIGAAMTAASFFFSGLLATGIGVIPLPVLLAARGVIVIAGVLPLGAAVGLAEVSVGTDPGGQGEPDRRSPRGR